MVNPINVLGSGKLNWLININFDYICIWEKRHHVQIKIKLKRQFQAIDVRDIFSEFNRYKKT